MIRCVNVSHRFFRYILWLSQLPIAYDSFSPAAKCDTDRDAERLTIRLGGDRYAVPTKLEIGNVAAKLTSQPVLQDWLT